MHVAAKSSLMLLMSDMGSHGSTCLAAADTASGLNNSVQITARESKAWQIQADTE